MSTLLEQASLIMIPSGYKEDVVYSVIPENGNGDLAFTRASNGTRVNSAGLVEVCPWNFIQYSEDFSNAAYTNIRINVTTNSVANPINGTVNADKLIPDTNNGLHALRQTVLFQTVFIYAKKGENDQIAFRDDGNTGNYASFNLTSGTIIDSSNSGGTQSITSVGNGWYLCQITFSTQGEYLLGVYCLSNSYTSGSPTVAYTGNGTDGLYAWGYQANIGSTAKPYFPTTDRLNVPRLTYQNGGGGCPSLLLEKQSTNLYPYSEDLTQWLTIGTPTVTGNDSTSPDGTTNADRVQFSGSGDLVYNSGTGSAGTNTLTVYAKAKTGTAQKFRFFANGATTFSSDFTATDQWQRFEFPFTLTVVTAGLSAPSTGASDVLFWGFQHEVSSYPTSYIPTTSSSATRVADACSKTGISSLFGTNQGTFFMDFLYINSDSGSGYLFDVTDSANTNRFLMYDSNGSGLYILYDSQIGSITTYQLTKGQRYKIGVKYNSTATTWYINGSSVATGGTFAYQMSQIYLNQRFSQTDQAEMQVNQSIVFPTALTNAELASLTTI